ncbi:hypothetical protein OAA60_03495 [Porticoccaceae bacterium]|nr:hypothetical protein [Porticoccaceae bacterium]
MIAMMQRDKRKRKSLMLKTLLASKPNVTAKQQQAMNTFNAISRSRKYTGQYASPLPLTEHDVIQHIQLHGCNCFESDIMINIILALDNEFLTLDAARRKAEANRG